MEGDRRNICAGLSLRKDRGTHLVIIECLSAETAGTRTAERSMGKNDLRQTTVRLLALHALATANVLQQTTKPDAVFLYLQSTTGKIDTVQPEQQVSACFSKW